MRGLTARQQQTLDFIRSRVERGQRPPTMLEIGKRLRVATRVAWKHVRALRRKGYVTPNEARHAAIALVPQRADSRFFLVLPVVCECGATYFGARCPACAGVFQEKAS